MNCKKVIVMIFLTWISYCSSAPVIWVQSDQFMAGKTFPNIGTITIVSPPTVLSSQTSFIIPFDHEIQLLTRFPVIGIVNFNYNLQSLNLQLSLDYSGMNNTALAVDFTCSNYSDAIEVIGRYLVIDGTFNYSVSMSSFKVTSSLAISSPQNEQYFVNFTQSTGVILNESHQLILLPFMNIFNMVGQNTSVCLDIYLDFFVANATHYSVTFRSESCNFQLFAFGFSRIIFDKSEIEAIGNSYFNYGIVEFNGTIDGQIVIPPPMMPNNLIYGIHSFRIINFPYIQMDSAIGNNINISSTIITTNTSSSFYLLISYLHHKKRTCPTTQPYYNISEMLCYDNCSFRYFQNTISMTCDPCAMDCFECDNAENCTNCSADDFRQLNGSRCTPIKGYFDNDTTIALKCTQQCETCSLSDENCTACKKPWYFKNSSYGKCQLCSDYLENCLECSNATDCQKCNSRSALNQSNLCELLKCSDTNCIQCVVSSKCTKCKKDYQVRNQVCIGICGDGIIAQEECDDGNLVNEDGCSDVCLIENYFACVNVPSDCFYNGTLMFYPKWIYKIQGENTLKVLIYMKVQANLQQMNCENISNVSTQQMSLQSQVSYSSNYLTFYIPYTQSLHNSEVSIYLHLYSSKQGIFALPINYPQTPESYLLNLPVKEWNNQASLFQVSYQNYRINFVLAIIFSSIVGAALLACIASFYYQNYITGYIVLSLIMCSQLVYYSLLSVKSMPAAISGLLPLRFAAGKLLFENYQAYFADGYQTHFDNENQFVLNGLYIYPTAFRNYIILIALTFLSGILFIIFQLKRANVKDQKLRNNSLDTTENIINTIELPVPAELQASHLDDEKASFNFNKLVEFLVTFTAIATIFPAVLFSAIQLKMTGTLSPISIIFILFSLLLTIYVWIHIMRSKLNGSSYDNHNIFMNIQLLHYSILQKVTLAIVFSLTFEDNVIAIPITIIATESLYVALVLIKKPFKWGYKMIKVGESTVVTRVQLQLKNNKINNVSNINSEAQNFNAENVFFLLNLNIKEIINSIIIICIQILLIFVIKANSNEKNSSEFLFFSVFPLLIGNLLLVLAFYNIILIIVNIFSSDSNIKIKQDSEIKDDKFGETVDLKVQQLPKILIGAQKQYGKRKRDKKKMKLRNSEETVPKLKGHNMDRSQTEKKEESQIDFEND